MGLQDIVSFYVDADDEMQHKEVHRYFNKRPAKRRSIGWSV